MANFYGTFSPNGGGGGGSGSNASVGLTGQTAPTSATEVAGVTTGGLLVPFKVDSSGDLYVTPAGPFTITDPAEGTPGATNPSMAIQVAGTDGTDLRTLSTTTTGVLNTAVNSFPLDTYPSTINITTQDIASTSNTYFNGQVWYSGTPTANSAASFALTNKQAGMIEVSGTWTGTLQVEISADNAINWIAHTIHQVGAANFITTFTNNIVGSIDLAAKTNVRIRAIAAMTGTATVQINLTANISDVYIANAVKLLDGSTQTSSTVMNIVPASTAVNATNTAIAVGLSPNSPLPTGTNALGSVTVSAISGTSSVNLAQVGGANVSLGQTTAANSIPVVLSSDQSDIAVNVSASIIQTTPTSNSMAALNATIQYSMDAGGNYYLTLTNGPGATTAWSGTVTFQYSLNGSTWNTLTVAPVASPANSASVTTSTTNGLWLIEAPAAIGTGSQIVYIRAQMTSYSSGTAYFFVTAQSPTNSRLLLPWIYTVTSGQTLVGPIEASGFSEIDLQISAITTTVYQVQGTNDPTLATWVVIPTISVSAQAASSVTGISTAGTYRAMTNGYKWIRVQCTTTGTVGTIQGISGTLAQQLVLTSVGNDIGVVVESGTLTTVTTVTGVTTVSNSNTALAGTAVADVASAAFTTTTTSATITPTLGSSFTVQQIVSAYTSGAVQTDVQESVDGGTTWYTIYGFPVVSSVLTLNSPCIVSNGNRYRYVRTAIGTTSLTMAVNRIQESQNAEAYYRSLVDTTISPTTTNSTTPTLAVENLNTYTTVINQGSGGSSVTFALDGSVDAVNWVQNLVQVAGVTGGATPVIMSYSASPFNYIRVRVVTGVASTTITSVSLVGSIGAGSGTIKPTNGTLTDNSSTTSSSASTSTTLMAANPSRKYLLIENLSTTAPIYINFTSAATAGNGSYYIAPLGSIVQETGFVSTEAINVLSTSTSVPYTAKQA
jgi:hypothetical protein